MAKVEIRLGSTLVLDSEKEKELIELVETASSQHKLGELLTHLLRIYSETPNKLKETTNDINKTIIEMSKYGITPQRYKFFNKVSRDMEAMKCKVDSIYDMCFEMYSLAKFGKRVGLEGKAENMLIAEFILEKQLNDLSDKLGIDNIRHTFSSNKLENTGKRADDTLEYILESYDNIINELKQVMFKEIELKVKPLDIEINNIGSGIGERINNGWENNNTTLSDNKIKDSIFEGKDKIKKHTEENKEEHLEDEVIDFGGADISALNNFFGN